MYKAVNQRFDCAHKTLDTVYSLGAIHKRRPHSGGEGGLIDLRTFADKGGGGVSEMRTSLFQRFPRRKIADCFIPFSVFRASVNHA